MHTSRQLMAALTLSCAAHLPDAELQSGARQVASDMRTAENVSCLLEPEANAVGSEILSEFSGLSHDLGWSSTHMDRGQTGCLDSAATAHCEIEVIGLTKFCSTHKPHI